MPLISRGRIGTRIAFAALLAGGSAVLLATPAQAQLVEQRQQRQQQQRQQQGGGETLSRNFQPAYEVVSNANTAGDLATAKAGVPAMIAAIASEYDRFFAGNILVQVGAKASDKALQQQGLELMLASGRATPEQVGLLHYLLGTVHFDSGNYDAAAREGQASLAAGFPGDFAQGQDPWALIADAYFRQNRFQEGLTLLRDTISQRTAAGQPVRPEWLPHALQIAVQQNLTAEAGELAVLTVQADPSPANWQQAIQVIGAMANGDPKIELDIMRLMSAANAMRDRNDYIRYIEAADPRIMSNEVARVLAAGVQAQQLTEGDQYYRDVKRVVDENAAKDQHDAPTLAAEARGANGSARAAQNAGDVFMSLGKYAEAEEMYALGVQKPGADRDLMLTRLGIAQIQQGKAAEAKATFAQVAGNRAALAKLWAAYASTRA